MTSDKDYSKEFQVSVSPILAFKAITSEIDKWWTVHSNIADQLNHKLTVRFGETTSKEMLVSALTKNQSLTWQVTKAYIDIEGLGKKDEWVGTEIKWEIIPTQHGCKVHFIHKGLTPQFECYDACEGGWNFFLESLRNYLDNGKGNPHGVK